MTFKEKLVIDYPERANDSWMKGYEDCPYEYGYEDYCACIENANIDSCILCWNREMEG